MIIVFGSINMDMIFQAAKLPEKGETVLCDTYDITSGGKGANQALAAARMEQKVALVGCTGDDGPALRMLRSLRQNGVMTSGVAESQSAPTGCAVVMTDKNGNNQILVASGANNEAKADQVPDNILGESNIVLMQMEVNPQENWDLIDRAHEGGAKTILNLAPAIKIPQASLEKLDYLIVNQIEARQIADALGIKIDTDAKKMAAALSKQGNLTCLVTLGPQGAVACTPEGELITVPAIKIENVVDTTGAGDAYCGTFAASLHAGDPLTLAMQKASVAGSLSCLKRGAQDSFPYEGDIIEQLENLGDVIVEKA